MLRELYEECVRVAASRGAQNARDLAHAVLLDVIARGSVDLSSVERRAFLFGALRKHAAFEARTAARRHAREQRWQIARDAGTGERVPWCFSSELLERLAPAVRVFAALASADLTPHEIRSVLRLSDTAFRKRASELRRAIREARAAKKAIIARPKAAFALGSARAELLANLRNRSAWAMASHDPDGHPLIFSRIGAHEMPLAGNSTSKEKP